ncbi:hypothetical protein LTR37_009827 [Vermiconidia calcicola]|uniref:Uncharacterized protein n=1 Tax=Vermiconidia calcicola TaxID=1690605 RepID=A0ACC3N6Z7_9PEZI|nr:hypothetical protein LTR37_009827 [Vermiconidia calcicola]
MASSVAITGAGRGIGYAFLTHYAAQPDTKVFGIVRNKEAAESKLANDGITNVTLVEADITDFKALQKAADEVSKITCGSLDLLINNAGIAGKLPFDIVSDILPNDLGDDLLTTFQTNVVGVAYTTNTFLPLIRKGQWKKVITISSGLADDVLTNQYSLAINGPYSISKAATNTLVAKYNAALGKSEGILFLALSPGVVATDMNAPLDMSEKDMAKMQEMGAKFAQYAPHFTGPISPQESVSMMVEVIDKATVEAMGENIVRFYPK